jgi:DEAD/DEAH box helicase domain-containing protein
MRFAHYRDAVRQAVALAIATQGAGTLDFISQISGQQLNAQEQASATAFAAANPSEAATLSMAGQPATANLSSPAMPGLNCQVAAQRIQARATNGPYAIFQLAINVSSQLLRQGMNPGGYSQDVLWTDPLNRAGHWRELYNWPMRANTMNPAKSASSLSKREKMRR